MYSAARSGAKTVYGLPSWRTSGVGTPREYVGDLASRSDRSGGRVTITAREDGVHGGISKECADHRRKVIDTCLWEIVARTRHVPANSVR